MKLQNLKNIILLLSESVFIIAVGLILCLPQFPGWINLIIYIMLFAEILWAINISYKSYDMKSNSINVLAFVLAIAIYLAGEITVSFIQIPTTFLTSYFFTVGYLLTNGCFLIYKRNRNNTKSWPLVVRFIGALLFVLFIAFGLANLFGLVTHR